MTCLVIILDVCGLTSKSQDPRNLFKIGILTLTFTQPFLLRDILAESKRVIEEISLLLVP